MILPALKIAVVGHTNTGKTSLMRTLMRDAAFGEVSDRPAVTRHVEGARLSMPGGGHVDLFDTPGLEDSMGLLEHLDTAAPQQKRIGIEQVRAFLEGPEARGRFAQEAKALRQVLDSDVALYVIDARDRVLAKHRDELEILSRCARPVVPVLNFIASEQANVSPWRSALAELNLHAVAEFDTVVFDEQGEIRLFEKLRTLLDEFQPTIDALIESRREQRRQLRRNSARLVAELAVDVAAYRRTVPTDQVSGAAPAVEAFRQQVRDRENRCVDDLLRLHQFTDTEYESIPLPIEPGGWGDDLFSSAAMRQFGIRTGGAAAAGALAGVAVDAMTAGLSLGAATALGAGIGAAIEFSRAHGRRILDRMRGTSELRCNNATVKLLLARQTALINALLRRGHAAQQPISVQQARPDAAADDTAWLTEAIGLLDEARLHPNWSSVDGPARFGLAAARREQIIQRITTLIDRQLER